MSCTETGKRLGAQQNGDVKKSRMQLLCIWHLAVHNLAIQPISAEPWVHPQTRCGAPVATRPTHQSRPVAARPPHFGMLAREAPRGDPGGALRHVADAHELGALAAAQVTWRGVREEGWSQTHNPCRSHSLSAARSASPPSLYSLVLSSRCRAPPVAFQYGHVCWTYSSTLMASANRYLVQGGEGVKGRGTKAHRHQSPQAPKCLEAEASASWLGERGRGPSTF